MSRNVLIPALAAILAASAWAGDAPAAEPAKAKPYPLDVCVVTDEKLDSMGSAITVVRDGQEVKLCCKSCLKAFDKAPAKYLAKIAEAAAKLAAPAQP